MDEQKGVNTTLRAIFSLVSGIILAFFVLGFFIIDPTAVENTFRIVIFLILPLFSYLLSLGINTLHQYISCGTISFPSLALASSLTPVFILIVSLLSYFVPFIRSLVETALPATADSNMKRAFGFAFYIFWAGIYSQTISSGLIQSCPGAAGPR
jgi:hypothetical protein